jgi:hypothetical protein
MLCAGRRNAAVDNKYAGSPCLTTGASQGRVSQSQLRVLQRNVRSVGTASGTSRGKGKEPTIASLLFAVHLFFMADSAGPSAAVSQISTSLDTLDDVLEPLLAAPFNETLARLDNLQKAKIQVLLGYVIHDLMWSMQFRLDAMKHF